MRRRGLFVATLAAALVAAGMQPSRAQVPPDVIDNVIARTVMLMIPVPDTDGNVRTGQNCSGSFVTPAGHILSASHCLRARDDMPGTPVKKGGLMNPEGLALVAINVPGSVNPVPMMTAKLIADSIPFDLAILKVVALVGQGGARPLPADFVVPYIKLGNSDAARHGEPIAVVGFPTIAGPSVTVNQGNVSGFLADDRNQKVWLKLDASGVGVGSSGGPVVNGRGEQVGVISRGFSGSEAARSVRAGLTNRIPTEWRQTARLDPASSSAGTQSSSGSPAPGAGGSKAGPAADTAMAQGRVVDAGTGAAIGGASVYMFKPGLNPRQATRDDVLASALTDGNGLFQTRPPVPRGVTYPFGVWANGYAPTLGYVELPADGAEPLQVKLQR
jgi:hypothetical protein